MKVVDMYYNSQEAVNFWNCRNEKDMLTHVLEIPEISIGRYMTKKIRTHVASILCEQGWIMDFPIDQSHQLTIYAKSGSIAFQLQTGNIARAAYDLLKLQYLFKCDIIKAATLAVPTKKAANSIGQNIANSDRIITELKLFDNVISVPLLVIAFE